MEIYSINTNPRPANTALKRRQSSSHTKMLEVKKTQGKEIVENMKKIGNHK
jgi:hypothetical protein